MESATAVAMRRVRKDHKALVLRTLSRSARLKVDSKDLGREHRRGLSRGSSSHNLAGASR